MEYKELLKRNRSSHEWLPISPVSHGLMYSRTKLSNKHNRFYFVDFHVRNHVFRLKRFRFFFSKYYRCNFCYSYFSSIVLCHSLHTERLFIQSLPWNNFTRAFWFNLCLFSWFVFISSLLKFYQFHFGRSLRMIYELNWICELIMWPRYIYYSCYSSSSVSLYCVYKGNINLNIVCWIDMDTSNTSVV